VQDQPVVSVAAERPGDDLLELSLDLIDCLPRREPGTIADAEDMRVDRKGLLAERGVEHDVRGLTADAGQFLEKFAGTGHFTAMLVDQRLG